MKKLATMALLSSAFLFVPATTRAQTTTITTDTASSSEAATDALVATAAPLAEAAAPPRDGVRFRGAIAASGGAEFASGFAVGMGGLEGRLGVQVSNLLGIYLQPSLAFGVGTVDGGREVFTGTAGVSALVDFTFENQFFVGVGGGVGILNNPIGPEIHLRIGGYPLFAVGEDGYSRQGLVIAADARVFFLFAGNDVLPVAQILGTIGYEVF